MGPPGVGKGTQARRLSKQLSIPHVSTGDILRDAVHGGSALGRRVRSFLDGGPLVPDEIMGDLVSDRLSRPDARSGFVLDGYPRTVEQVGILDRVLARLGVTLDRVFVMDAPDEVVIRRLSGRRVCPGCGALYHLETRMPKSPGICEGCGSALVQRPDDAEEVVRERLKVYEAQTRPAISTYADRGLVQTVDASGDPDAVFHQMQAGLAEA